MGQLILFLLSFTTLATECLGNFTTVSLPNWFMAQMVCRSEGKVLPSNLPNAIFSSQYYWTGYHIRRSNWIQIIGCFEETDVKRLTRESYSVHFPSAGLCQEFCLNSNALVFGLKSNVCACLDHAPSQESKGPIECELPCDKEYSNETSIKFRNDCGGRETYTLFKSGFYPDPELSQSQTHNCLSIQCGLKDNRFVERRCSVMYLYDIVCNTTAYPYSGNWNEAAELCKAIYDSYLLGNIDLTDVDQTCSIIQGQLNGPSWLGIAKETYISMDGVQDETLKLQSSHRRRCLKCNRENCVFADCFEHHNFMCMEKEKLSKTQINNKESGSTLNATNETGSKDSSSRLIAVPVCLSLLLLLICASLIVIIIRRKKLKESENMEEPSSNKSNSVDYADYSNVGNLTENSYSELQQPNTTNQSANYSQLQFEGPDQNDYVDLRENNVAIERYSNDIYDNMAFA